MYNYWCSMSLFLGMRLVFKVENKERIHFQLVNSSCKKPPIVGARGKFYILTSPRALKSFHHMCWPYIFLDYWVWIID